MQDENRLKMYKGVVVNMGDNGEPNVDLLIKGIPLKLWKKWKKSCQNDYHDIRWLKLWSDHLIARGEEKERDEIVAEVMERIIHEAQQQPEQEENDEDEIQVLSGKAR